MKPLQKLQKFFRILEDTSESDDSEDSTDIFDSSEGEESSLSEESSESEESSLSEESSESEESSLSEESSESEEPSQSDESSESEEPSQSDESSESEESSLSEEASDSNESVDTSLETTFKTEQTDSPDVYDPVIGKRLALIHILLFTNFRYVLRPSPIIITFTLYVTYIGVIPFQRITFTIRIIFVILRELQNSEQNSTTLCTINNYDESNGVAKYTCQAESEREPSRVISHNDFLFDGKEYRIGPEINFSPEAGQGSKNLQNEVSEIDNNVYLL